MKAGRELDALIHKKVMKLPTGPNGRMGTYNVTSHIVWSDGRPNEMIEKRMELPEEHYVPSYSTDIAAAMEIPAKIHANFTLERMSSGPWRAYFWHYLAAISSPTTSQVMSKEPAEAICLAALKYLGIGNGD